jgi:hypothetical protein
MGGQNAPGFRGTARSLSRNCDRRPAAGSTIEIPTIRRQLIDIANRYDRMADFADSLVDGAVEDIPSGI